MDAFEIVISDSPYEMLIRPDAPDSSTIIDSVFFVRTDSGSFPCQDWTDFSLYLLYQWCENMLRMPTEENAKCILYFMDGPYWFDVEKKGDIYVFQGRWDKKDYQKEFEGSFTFQCSLQEFFSELLRAFRKIIKILNQKQVEEWVQNEVMETYQHYKKLVEQRTQRKYNQGTVL